MSLQGNVPARRRGPMTVGTSQTGDFSGYLKDGYLWRSFKERKSKYKKFPRFLEVGPARSHKSDAWEYLL